MTVKKSQYHHQDLFQTVLKAGRLHVEMYGHASLSLRKIAEGIGVAPSAIYHHFKNRQAILTAVAVSGFETLHALAPNAASMSEMSPHDNLKQLATSFVIFAREHQNLFRLMYESGLSEVGEDDTILAAQHMGYNLMVAGFEQAYPDASVTEIKARVVAFWSTVYGFCHLTERHMLQPSMLEGLEPDTLLDYIVGFSIGEP